MSLFDMNALWFRDFTTCKICFSLLAINLAIILYITLYKLIGLYFVTSLGFSTFGIKAM